MKRLVVLGAAALLAAGPAGAEVTLNASSWVPAHPLTTDALQPLCADIEKATAGRVKCSLLPKAPVAAPQTFDAVRDGLVDLSFHVHGYTPGRFALTEAPEFPFMGDTATSTAVAYQRVHEKMLARADEHKGVTVLAVFTHGPGQVFNARRAVRSLKDFERLKLRVGSRLASEMAKALGAVPVHKPAPESQALLSSGAIDGVLFPKESPASFKLTALLRHATYVPGGLYNTSFAWIANPAKWSAIPADDRRLIEPLLGEALARRTARMWDAADRRGEAALRAENVSVVVAGPALIADIKARTAALEKAWIETRAKPKGVDGAAVLEALRAHTARK